MTKVAHRSPLSRKYVVKPKIGASSHKKPFDKCFLAIDVIPRAYIEFPEEVGGGNHGRSKLTLGKALKTILYLKNPGSIPVEVVLKPRSGGRGGKCDDGKGEGSAELKEEKQQNEGEQEKEEGVRKNRFGTQVDIPINKVTIPAYDSVVEDLIQSMAPDVKKEQDGLVTFQKLSKLGIPIEILPAVSDSNGNITFSLDVILRPRPKAQSVTRLQFRSFTYVMHFNLGQCDA
mmetsp:Transcript_5996/g.9945  ORF Transcript_5996/g.9945 Transcript_5996/m.9945 type:complete len:231 (+) Transcript_5996:606-1298(+)